MRKISQAHASFKGPQDDWSSAAAGIAAHGVQQEPHRRGSASSDEIWPYFGDGDSLKFRPYMVGTFNLGPQTGHWLPKDI